MKSSQPYPVILAAALLGPIAAAQGGSAPPPWNESQAARIGALVRETKAAEAGLRSQVAARQDELARAYAEYALDEAAAGKLRGEIFDLQRRLLESHHRMQVELRSMVDKERFEILRRRLEGAEPPSASPMPTASEGSPSLPARKPGESGIERAPGNRLETARPARPHGRMEEMRPDELERVLAEAPVAFVPVGTFEHHGWHLPVCFDGIKAHALCERVAERTGGTVLPTFFYGTGGGHVGYKWTLMLPESRIAPLLEATLDHAARQGFKVVVLLTGHYPQEQVDMVHRLAREAGERHPEVRFIGLTEPEVTTPLPGDAYGGDHAAKYETSIALALHPDWVRLDRLTAGREPRQVTLPDTPRGDASTHDPTHPLYAIHGQDPRAAASREVGEKLVAEIVSRLARQVEEAAGRGARE